MDVLPEELLNSTLCLLPLSERIEHRRVCKLWDKSVRDSAVLEIYGWNPPHVDYLCVPTLIMSHLARRKLSHLEKLLHDVNEAVEGSMDWDYGESLNCAPLEEIVSRLEEQISELVDSIHPMVLRSAAFASKYQKLKPIIRSLFFSENDFISVDFRLTLNELISMRPQVKEMLDKSKNHTLFVYVEFLLEFFVRNENASVEELESLASYLVKKKEWGVLSRCVKKGLDLNVMHIKVISETGTGVVYRNWFAYEDLDTLKRCCELGFLLDPPIDGADSPVNVAIYRRDLKMLKWILDQDARLVTDKSLRSHVAVAISTNFKEAARLLLNRYEMSPSSKVILFAMNQEDPRILDMFLYDSFWVSGAWFENLKKRKRDESEEEWKVILNEAKKVEKRVKIFTK